MSPLVLSCLLSSLAQPLPRFVAVPPSECGIDFVNVCGSREKDWLVEVNGGGVALFDAENDGDLDVFLVNGGRLEAPASQQPSDRLYLNEGGWRFRDVTAEAGLIESEWGGGAAVADFDNDGHLDLYVANRGPNTLWRNLGGGRFARLASSGAEDPSWSAAAAGADFDGDGFVDLYVANYIDFRFDPAKRRGAGACSYKGQDVACGPGGLTPAADNLYLNSGGRSFRQASAEWGLRDTAPAYGLGALVVDVGRDGRPDVLVANDTMADFCFLNRGGKRFEEAALFLGLAFNGYGVAQASMGLASGDIRGLGREDIVVSVFEDDTNTLHLADAAGRFFTDGTYAMGLGGPSYPFLGWGLCLFDAEGDGDLDLFVANGHIFPQIDAVRGSIGYRQRNQLFLNDGSGRFRECLAEECGPGLAVLESSRGAAFGDLDGDGDPDLVVNNIDAPPTLLRNDSTAPASWVELHLAGRRSNAAAIGAWVELFAGGRRQERQIQCGMGWASQSELAARFGLGAARAVTSVRVRWPSGLREDFDGFEAPVGLTRRRLIEGEGKALR